MVNTPNSRWLKPLFLPWFLKVCGLLLEQGYFILKKGAIWYDAAQIILKTSTTVSEIEIIKAFAAEISR